MRRRSALRAACRGLGVALLALSGCRPAAPPEAPRIAFSHIEHDAGRVRQGQALRHAFGFRNDGGSDLLIDHLRTGCDCTASIASSATIAPRASAAIELECSTDRVFGHSRRTVTVYSSDPKHEVVLLVLSAEVEADVAVDPPELYVGHLPRGGSVSQTLAVVGARARAGALRVSSDGPILRAAVRPAAGNGTPERIAFTVRDDAPLGDFVERVVIESEGDKAVDAVVTGTVDGAVTVSPARAEFGDVVAGEHPSQILVVRSTGASPGRVLSAEVSTSWASTELETVEEGREYRVRVALRDPPAGVLHAILTLHTDEAEETLVRVPINAAVKGSL